MGEHVSMSGLVSHSPYAQALDLDLDLDYNQPISVLLKMGTANVHEAAHRSEAVSRLVRGQLTRDQYVLYLFMLWRVYDLLESLLTKNCIRNNDPTLTVFCNSRISGRSIRLADDIDHILNSQTWREHPPFQLSTQMTEALNTYLQRLTDIDRGAKPGLLLAHIYVRILGDLSGGQIIKRAVQKAYRLEKEAVSFYQFGSMREDVKRIKVWFKEQMDQAVGVDDVEMKGLLVAEARLAFGMNVALIDSLISHENNAFIACKCHNNLQSDLPCAYTIP